MAISHCDACSNFRPGSSGTAPCGTEGFFCHICRGDVLDPYCEIEENIEQVEASLADAVRKAETGKDWAYIAWAEEEFLAPLLALRKEAATERVMAAFDRAVADIKNWVEAA